MADHSPPPRTTSARMTLLIVVLTPVLSLAALWGFAASITLGNVVHDQRYNTFNHTIAANVIALEQSLAAERTLTVMWLDTDRQPKQIRAQLLTARQATDRYATGVRASIASVRGLADPASAAELDLFYSDLAGLSAIRSKVDAGTDSTVTAFNAYGAIDDAESSFFRNATQPGDVGLSVTTQASIDTGQAEFEIEGAISLISGALARQGSMPQSERALLATVAGEQDVEVDEALALAPSSLKVPFERLFNSAVFHDIETAENQAVNAPVNRPIPVGSAPFQTAVTAYHTATGSTLQTIASVTAAQSTQLSDSLLTQLFLAGGLGLAAVLASIFVGARFGRRLRVELTLLYESARQMADERLPRLVERLRRGDDVDAKAESPPLRAGRITEIASVARAFSSVQRTAIEAAVSQAMLRKGVNEVFVSLSLRSQSLLQRQLGMLDDMERATSDPVALGDLFQLDHLTTRMRRHAEGLLVLAGSTPGRIWRDPVPVADVLNAAVAEVEDYIRVDVVADSTDAVAGTAVNDVIHLFAELVENATTFSPPKTQVEVRGDSVGHGFAVEVEDRGLGMRPEEIAALNDRLAQPPEFDLANTDQLGLFVAARLARRHGIKISLRPSPYGGTTAIVLLPPAIIVPAQEAYRAGGTAGGGQDPFVVSDESVNTTATAGHDPRHGGTGSGAPTSWLSGRHRRLSSEPALGTASGSDFLVRSTLPERGDAGHPTGGWGALPPAVRDIPRPPWEPQAPTETPTPGGLFGRGQTTGHAEHGVSPAHARRSGAMPDSARPGEAAPGGSRPGLPRRARGTSLAPQLREKLSKASALTDREGPGSPAWPGGLALPVAEEPPTRSAQEASSTLSALQEGWERARNEDPDWFEDEDHR